MSARVTARFGEVLLPQPRVVTSWIREHAPREGLPVRVVELREESPPPGCQPIRWVLDTTEAADHRAAADLVIEKYQRRPTMEDDHKCYKTGWAVEGRQ